MTIDRYTKAVLTVIAVALVVIAARPYFPSTSWPQVLRVTPAQAQSIYAREATITKTCVKYVKYSGSNLQLQGRSKSVHIVNRHGKLPEYPKLKRIVKF